MRLACSLLLISLGVLAQTQVPGIVRGRLLELETAGPTGELSVRGAGNQVHRFSFDAKTYVERDRQRILPSRLEKGDDVEIVSDLGPSNSLRYARTIHVVEREQQKPRPPVSAGRFRLSRAPVEDLIPRGNLTFSGLICRLNEERIVLRTRVDGEKIIYLRPDTRYLQSGAQVQASALRTNTRVFVRGSRNLENEIEAYTVVWGEILNPHVTR